MIGGAVNLKSHLLQHRLLRHSRFQHDLVFVQMSPSGRGSRFFLDSSSGCFVLWRFGVFLRLLQHDFLQHLLPHVHGPVTLRATAYAEHSMWKHSMLLYTHLVKLLLVDFFHCIRAVTSLRGRVAGSLRESFSR